MLNSSFQSQCAPDKKTKERKTRESYRWSNKPSQAGYRQAQNSIPLPEQKSCKNHNSERRNKIQIFTAIKADLKTN